MIKINELNCRLCLKQCSESNQNSLTVNKDYSKYIGYSIIETDVPKKICKVCMRRLRQVVNFIKQCWDIESKLANLKVEEPIEDKNHELQVPVISNYTLPKLEDQSSLVCKTEKVEPEDVDDKVDNKFLSDNKKTSTDQHKVICQYCGVLCKKKDLKVHLEKHNPVKLFFCHFCNKHPGFSSKYRILEHLKSSHMSKDIRPQYPCSKCDRYFNTKTSRDSHYYRHHVDPKDYRFGCLICGRRFFKKHLLDVHNRTHSGEKRYSCDICQAKFSLPQHVRVHVANIHNPKVVVCSCCGKSFTSEKYLQQHMLTHVQGGYTCPLCPDKKFSLTTTLRTHMRTSHPTFPCPPPGTKLKNYSWEHELALVQLIT